MLAYTPYPKPPCAIHGNGSTLFTVSEIKAGPRVHRSSPNLDCVLQEELPAIVDISGLSHGMLHFTLNRLSVIFFDWVNLGSLWWSRSLTGLDPVDLIG